MLQTIGDTLCGFTVTRIRPAQELGGRLVEMTYEKTGTELVWVDNHVGNKLFSIAFKTLPENSTGVFHILEHSVLCGSDKYPVREPFVELLKSSMNTFLNAMTFPDKTMYPVASRNDRDFLNLAGVYLDAVFAPAILHDPNIFYQEGWHIENGEDGALSYKGVVFNEMKGALSSVNELAEYKLMEMLFPDSCYGYNSGGDPAVIPTLTYEQFLETYRRFYHPSNARIFLDGDIPLEETLSMLDSYLSKYERSADLPELTMQQPVASAATQYYELAADEPLENRSCLTIGRLTGTWQERVKLLAQSVLLDALAGSNEAPLKRAVLSAGLAQVMSMSVEEGLYQNYLMIHLKNVTDGRADEILPLIRQTARQLLEDGLDYDALEASCNQLEFRTQEPEEPQALGRCIDVMNSWLYGGDPMQYLVCQADFAAVRQMLRERKFEELLRDLLLDETGTAVLYTLPSHTRGEELRREEAERLAAFTADWTDADRAANALLNEKLVQWQATPDTPEQLATLPTLPLSEVSPEPMWVETTEQLCEGVTVLYHQLPTRSVVYLTLYFSLTDYAPEDFTALMLVTCLLGKLGTAKHSGLALQQTIKHKIGRLSFSIDPVSAAGQVQTCMPKLAVRCSVLQENLADAKALILEILQSTDFTQKDKIREILSQTNERMKQVLIRSGHALALGSAMSHYNAAHALIGHTSGYPAIKRMQAMVDDFDAFYENFLPLTEHLCSETFCRARLLCGVTAAEAPALADLLAALPEGTPAPADMTCTTTLPERMGYAIPAQIGFAAQCWDMAQAGLRYNGAAQVAAKIISLSYLWNVVRVQGGAYGTGLHLSSDGGMSTYSYRDPSPAGALAANKEISAFLRDFCESGEEMDKFIISTINDEDPLLDPASMGSMADKIWMSGRKREELERFRREMLATDKAALLETCALWEHLANDGAVCVCAATSLLADCGDLTVME